MIVIDENIHNSHLLNSIRRWYRGQVLSITDLRPQTVIKDDAIAELLLDVQSPTFVTINVGDFWRRIPPTRAFVSSQLPFPNRWRYRFQNFSADCAALELRLLDWYVQTADVTPFGEDPRGHRE